MVGIYAEDPQRPRFPWYKQQKGFNCQERLRCGVLSTLDTSSWIGIASGLDDFRSGPPNPSSGKIKPSKPGFRIKHPPSALSDFETVRREDVITLTKADSTASLTVPKYKQKRMTVDNIESRLQQHPLVLFPYLESDLPFEVFTKLIGMVAEQTGSKDAAKEALKSDDSVAKKSSDRFMKRNKPISRAAVTGITVGTLSSESADLSEQPVRPRVSVFLRDGQMNIPLNPYLAFLRRIKFKSSGKAPVFVPMSHVDEPKAVDIQKITEEFCEWVRSIGGEEDKYNIDSDKIFTLFDIDDKPTVVSTIQVLDKQQIPTDLLVGVKMSSEEILTKAGPQKKRPRRKKQKLPPIRHRYGAWYLPVTLWKKLDKHELLEDPIEIQKREEYLASFETKQLDKKVANLYSTKALRNYIIKHETKVPKFLRNVPLPDEESTEVVASVKGSTPAVPPTVPGKTSS